MTDLSTITEKTPVPKCQLCPDAGHGVSSFFKDNTGRKLSAKLLANPSIKTLDSVATIYHLAKLSHAFTNISVAKSLGIYKFEGSRLVRLAKLEGHIHT